MYFPTLDLFLLTSSLENMYFIALRKSSYYYYLKKKSLLACPLRTTAETLVTFIDVFRVIEL